MRSNCQQAKMKSITILCYTICYQDTSSVLAHCVSHQSSAYQSLHFFIRSLPAMGDRIPLVGLHQVVILVDHRLHNLFESTSNVYMLCFVVHPDRKIPRLELNVAPFLLPGRHYQSWHPKVSLPDARTGTADAKSRPASEHRIPMPEACIALS